MTNDIFHFVVVTLKVNYLIFLQKMYYAQRNRKTCFETNDKRLHLNKFLSAAWPIYGTSRHLSLLGGFERVANLTKRKDLMSRGTEKTSISQAGAGFISKDNDTIRFPLNEG